MLFASYAFLLFIFVVITGYYIIPGKYQWIYLLIASYVFYWFADPYYLIFIFFTSLSIFFCARRISELRIKYNEEYESVRASLDKEQRREYKTASKRHERRYMLLALVLNIGILAVLKYTNFAISNMNGISKLFNRPLDIPYRDIILPMGISFYTFQAVGYLLDVYNSKYEAERSFLRLALFVSFFPQLVQGPISRYSDLSKSLYERHEPDKKNITYGLQRILWGYFKKLVIADRILAAVNAIFHDPDIYYGIFVFIGMIFYALELYADFTGGIDITIGIAQTLGIEVAENFQRPFFSKNVKEYWKRWHITMGTWFTDYIFFPLSVSKTMQRFNKFSRAHFGNYVGKRLPVYICSFVVWFTTGIWHGASWNFIVWGLGNYVIIMISDEISPMYDRFHSKFDVRDRQWYKLFQIIRTFILMSCLRLFDCYRDVPLTLRMFGTIFFKCNLLNVNAQLIKGLNLMTQDYIILATGTLILITVSLIQRTGSVREKISGLPFAGRYVIWFGLFLITILFGAYGVGYDETQFIYNQF